MKIGFHYLYIEKSNTTENYVHRTANFLRYFAKCMRNFIKTIVTNNGRKRSNNKNKSQHENAK